jgi:hypothetical protein
MMAALRPFVSRLPATARLREIPPCPRHSTPTTEDLRKALDSGSGLDLEHSVAEVAADDPEHYGRALRRIVTDLRNRTNWSAAADAIIQHPATYLDATRATEYRRAFALALRDVRPSA